MNITVNRLGGTTVWSAHWVLLAVACNVTGWALSFAGLLGSLGLALGIPAVWVGLHWLCRPGIPKLPGLRVIKRWLRLRHGSLHLAFVGVVALSFWGGCVHAPNNYDAMNFRLPKILAWLMEGGWQWFPANNHSMNTRASGMEWAFAPLLSWTGGDRLLFLANQLPFLLMPGLVFSLFRQLGVGRRASRFWMWVVPTGYGFALQAGGIGNDLPAAIFALAAFDFGLRWRRSGETGHALLALFAAAMMTAVKPTTLPLMLPFTMLFLRMFGLLRKAPLRVVMAVVPLVLASFLPTAYLNHRQCGDWTGAAAENQAYGRVELWVGIAGNLINAPLQNLVPPLFPWANAWNEKVVTWFPEAFMERMASNFEARGARFGVTDIQGEESAGLGVGILGMIMVGLLFGRVRGSSGPWIRKSSWLALGFGLALLAYFSKAGLTTVARHILPYYPFLMVPLLMVPRLRAVVRKRWFQVLGWAAAASTMVMLCVTPSRPVLPMESISRALAERSPSPALQRLALGYQVYGQRADLLGSLRDALPEGAVNIGFINHASGPESPLWKPYGDRRVCHLPPGVDPVDAWAGPVRHVVLNTKYFHDFRGETPGEWLARLDGRVLLKREIRPLVKEPPSEWWVVELPEPVQP